MKLRKEQGRRGAGRIFPALGFAFLLAVPGVLSFAQTHISIEEKIQYEDALARKVQEVLVNILGPSQARVSVEAQVERPKEQEAAPPFKWAGISQDPTKNAQQLLPG